LATLFASDDYYTTPDSSSTALPTFLGNHDMGRIGHFVMDSGDALARSQLAHSLMYLTRGQPVVYYGDEQGLVGDGSLGGTDKDARQDMFATQVAEYANQDLLTGEPAGSQDRFDRTAPLYTHIAELAALREATPALESGAQIERPDTGPGKDFGHGLTEAEVRYLMAHEWARNADDILFRRTKLGIRFSKAERDKLQAFMDKLATTPAAGQVSR